MSRNPRASKRGRSHEKIAFEAVASAAFESQPLACLVADGEVLDLHRVTRRQGRDPGQKLECLVAALGRQVEQR